MIIHLVAEGYMEEAVASRLIPFCGHELGAVYGKKGNKATGAQWVEAGGKRIFAVNV